MLPFLLSWKCKYSWRELEVIGFTTVTGVVTFIQFALIPLEKADSKANVSFLENINLEPIKNVFLAPFEFIHEFEKIGPPMRVLIFAVIIFALISFLTLGFFYPTWHMLIYLLDLFLPGMFCFGCGILYSDYTGIDGPAIAALVVGLIWVLLRLAYYIIPWIFKKDKNWEKNISLDVAAVFLGRITHKVPKEELDTRVEQMKAKIYSRDPVLDSKRMTMFDKIFDIALAGGMSILIIILTYGVTWKRMISNSYDGAQLDHIAALCDIICYALLTAFLLRTVTSILYFFDKLEPKMLWLRRLAFKGACILAGLVLMPVLDMILSSTDTEVKTCPYGQYFDCQVNQSSFLDYFRTKPNVDCQPCSTYHIYSSDDAQFHYIPGTLHQCHELCTNNHTIEYQVVKGANYILNGDLTAVFMAPCILLEVYVLAFFLQALRDIFTLSLDIVENLPAPSISIESKFASIVDTLKSTGVYVFTSYQYKQSLFYFTFTQFKLYALFFSSVMLIFPSEEIKNHSRQIISGIFTVISLLISIIQGVSRPYRSLLHNVTNCISYFVGAIASLCALLSTAGIEVPSKVGTLMLCLIFVVPCSCVIIGPIFLRFDPLLGPLRFRIAEIKQRDELYRRRKMKKNRANAGADSDSSFESDSTDVAKNKEEGEDDSDNSRMDDLQVPGFALINVCPIHITRNLSNQSGKHVKNRNKLIKQARAIWGECDVIEGDLVRAGREMFDVIDALLDQTSFAGLMRLLTISTLLTSGFLGWALGAGVAQWKVGRYIRCDRPFYWNGEWPIRN